MADSNSTSNDAKEGRTPLVLAGRIGSIYMRGDDLKQISGLLDLCHEDIYKEIEAIKQIYSIDLEGHSQALTGYIGFLADTVQRIAEQIENECDEVADALREMAKGGAV